MVEITPIGIQSLKSRFYIIWLVFNLAFIPTVYLFYPETADRTLEDIDAYYRDQPSLFVFRDKDATNSKRPAKYIEAEEEEVRRASSVDPSTFRRGSRVSMPSGPRRGMSSASAYSHSTLGAGQQPMTDHIKEKSGSEHV